MEQKDVLVEEEIYTHQLASKGKRFANYLIDVIAFYVLIIPIALIMGGAIAEGGAGLFLYYLLVIGIMIAYYTFMEYKYGKTLGKMITKCKVIDDETGGKPTVRQAFLRTISRFVPFEGLSLLFGDKAWHDSWIDTSVVDDLPKV